MKTILIIIVSLLILSIKPIVAQPTVYNPQNLYEKPGGLYDKDSIRELSIAFYESNYHDILVNSWYNDPDYRLPAKLIFNGTQYDSVAVRYKGNSTFCLPNDMGIPKVPYNIDVNAIVGGQNILGQKKLKLANAWLDPTCVKEIISTNIYRKYLPTFEANLIKLNVQGNYLGLYVNLEPINKQFLKKHFNESSGVLFKCDRINRYCGLPDAPSGLPANLFYRGDDTTRYYNSYDLKSEYGWEELVKLMRVIDLDFNNIDSVLNVDRTLWAFAVNQVILNLDCYNLYHAHNYYLYQTGDGLFQMIPTDLDNGFVGALLADDHRNPAIVYEFDPFYTGPAPGTVETSEERPLLFKLLNDPFYRKLYTAHIRTIINESLDTSFIRSEINNIQNLGYSALDDDQNKLFSMKDYHSNVESPLVWQNYNYGFGGIMSSIDARKQYLLEHPELSRVPPSLHGPDISNKLVTISASNAKSVELLATTNEHNSKFQAFSMYDDGTNGDAVQGDGIYSTTLPFQSSMQTIKYYFRAENEDALSLSPERAEYEFYLYSASEAGDMVINEFAASNETIQPDQDGEFDDWIELYNNTSSDRYLDGYFLSDKSEDRTKWTFPRGITIKAQDYLIVWADNDTLQDGLHTNFKLSSSGEGLYLSDATGNTIDFILFGPQEEDITSGRYPNGKGQFTRMRPTFSAENNNGITGILDVIKPGNFKVYPNPANSFITIERDLYQPAEIKVFSSMGKLMFCEVLKNRSHQIDLSLLPSGIFYIQVVHNNERFYCQKIIKN